MITPERAQQIRLQAIQLVEKSPAYGLIHWSAKVKDVVTDEELDFISEVWETMDGNTCWFDAFLKILNEK